MNISELVAKNQARWEAMKLVPSREAGFKSSATRLSAAAAKTRYEAIAQATGVPWFVVAVIHEREAGGPPHFDRSIAQGDPLAEVSTHVPAGRGPFLNHPTDPQGQDAFYRGAL